MKSDKKAGATAVAVSTVLLGAGLVALGTSQAVSSTTSPTPVPTCALPTGTISNAKMLAYNECRFNRVEVMLGNHDGSGTAPSPSPTQTTSSSPTPTATSTPTQTSTPTATSTPTSPTGCVKPDASNTGHTGTLTAYSGSNWVDTPGTVIENKTVNGDLTIAGANVVVRNSRVTGSITVYPGGNDSLITGNTAEGGIAVSSAHRVIIEKNDVTNTNGNDALHVTSDQGIYINTATIRNNWIHDPYVPNGAHYDGLQVRGATNVLVDCNNFDLGAYQEGYNAPVYLENDNGGYSNARVTNNWLLGGAFNIMLGSANDAGVKLNNNKVGGAYRWDICATFGDPAAMPSEQNGNTLNGSPVTPCHL